MNTIGWAIVGLLQAATPSLPPVSRHILTDGTELLVATMPGASGVSMRYLVHSGGTADPPRRAGLAHLVEHLVFHGSPTFDGALLFERVRESGAYINAFTGTDSTVYVLDTPGADLALVEAYVGMISNPALGIAPLTTEQGVVATEADLRPSEGVLWLVDQVVYPGAQGGASVIGSTRSRLQIQQEDVLTFYSKNYTPDNTTVILAGAIDGARAVQLLESSLRLAPAARPSEQASDEAEEPNIPATSKVPAPFAATVRGFLADGTDLPVCEDLAALLELRAMRALVAEKPLAMQIDVGCHHLRGHLLLVSTVFSSILDGPKVNETLDNNVRDLSSSLSTSKERGIIGGRRRRHLEEAAATPAAWANLLSRRAAAQGPRGDRKILLNRLKSVDLTDPERLRRAAEAVFTEERQFTIQLTLPFM